jgi:hypothetical protein
MKANGGFNFSSLMKEVAPLPYAEVVKECELVLAYFDQRIGQRVEGNDVWFTLRLRGFLFFLNTGRFLSNGKPDAPLYRPVVAALVDKGELENRFLEAVDDQIDAGLGKQLNEVFFADPVLHESLRVTLRPPETSSATAQTESINLPILPGHLNGIFRPDV